MIKDLGDARSAVIRKQSPGLNLARIIAEHTSASMAKPSALIRRFQEERDLIETLRTEELK